MINLMATIVTSIPSISLIGLLCLSPGLLCRLPGTLSSFIGVLSVRC